MPPTSHRHQKNTIDLDRAGAAASLTCAVHCAVMPMVVTLLPLIGLSFLADERLEWGLLGSSGAIGLTSLCLGYREHKRRRPLALLSLGFALAAIGRIGEARGGAAFGIPLVVIGGITIAASHFFNRYLCKTCRDCRQVESMEIDRKSQPIHCE